MLIHGMKLLGLLMMTTSVNSYSQNDTVSPVLKADTLRPSSKVSLHTLYTGIGYGSNMIYLGSTISGNQPFLYNAFTYGFKSEFFVTASAIHLSNIDPFLAFYIGSINYNHVFNSWFDISAGVYRYEITPSLADTLFSSFTYGDFTLGIDWRLLYTKLSAGVLFSDENLSYFQMKNSRYIQTPEFFRKKVNISFDPYVNILLGTLFKSEQTTETFITTSSTNLKWRYNNPNNSNSTNTSNTTSSSVTTTSTNTSFARSFGLMEVDFGIPVALNADHFTFEAEATYVLPLYNDTYFPGPKGFILMLSGIFRIF
jgi:hypothetical protein